MKLSAYGVSDVGRVRKNNEDFFLIDDAHGLYAVCDGVGGVAGGEIASAMTVRKLADWDENRMP